MNLKKDEQNDTPSHIIVRWQSTQCKIFSEQTEKT